MHIMKAHFNVSPKDVRRSAKYEEAVHLAVTCVVRETNYNICEYNWKRSKASKTSKISKRFKSRKRSMSIVSLNFKENCTLKYVFSWKIHHFVLKYICRRMGMYLGTLCHGFASNGNLVYWAMPWTRLYNKATCVFYLFICNSKK